MKSRHPQSGFSAVEALLLLVILGILGFTGYFVYHSKQNTDKTLTNTGNSNVAPVKSNTTTSTSAKTKTVTSPTVSDAQKYLVIKEWGVELPLDNNFIDATYACLGQNCSVPDEFGISTSSLSTLDAQCDANASGIGFITRSTTTGNSASSSVKIGNYYYNATPTTSHCSDSNDSANQKQSSYTQAFKDAASGIKAVN